MERVKFIERRRALVASFFVAIGGFAIALEAYRSSAPGAVSEGTALLSTARLVEAMLQGGVPARSITSQALAQTASAPVAWAKGTQLVNRWGEAVSVSASEADGAQRISIGIGGVPVPECIALARGVGKEFDDVLISGRSIAQPRDYVLAGEADWQAELRLACGARIASAMEFIKEAKLPAR